MDNRADGGGGSDHRTVATEYWPAHRFVRFARFTIFAFTGRPRAALAMIEKRETAPQNYTPEALGLVARPPGRRWITEPRDDSGPQEEQIWRR